MRNLDFSSWQGILSSLLALAVITLLGVGIRLLVMQTVQQRRERENRQINERLAPRFPFRRPRVRTARGASAMPSKPRSPTSSC
jgi:heme exporter protein D